VISYRVMLDVPRELVLFVSGLLAERRREIGTRKGTRKLSCCRQAVFGLAWYRDKPCIRRLGAGFGLSQATAYRYIDEVTDVLAARAPGLREALERALAEGTPLVILDGKLFRCDRCARRTVSVRDNKEIHAWYSGKKKAFGGNVQALFYPDGRPMWLSDAFPGHVNDLGAARDGGILPALALFTAAMPALADGGYEHAGHGIHAPVSKNKGLTALDIDTQARNALIRSVRCKGERGFALLTQRWQALKHTTASPSQITHIAKAALVLVQFEHKMLT
jgi:DDE superfamily endonuclease